MSKLHCKCGAVFPGNATLVFDPKKPFKADSPCPGCNEVDMIVRIESETEVQRFDDENTHAVNKEFFKFPTVPK